MSTQIVRFEPGLSRHSAPQGSQRAAFERLEANIRAVSTEDLVPLNIDPHFAAGRVLGAAPRFLSLRPRMATLAPELNLWLVDNSVPLAHAYLYTSAGYVELNELTAELPLLLEEGVALRAKLQLHKRALMQCGLLAGRHLSGLKRSRGYHAVAHDLTALMRCFDDNWTALEGRTAVPRSDIEQALPRSRSACSSAHFVAANPRRPSAPRSISGTRLLVCSCWPTARSVALCSFFAFARGTPTPSRPRSTARATPAGGSARSLIRWSEGGLCRGPA